MSVTSSPNAYLAVALQWIGGLGSASFYLPFSRVRRWSWETYWLVGGFFSWIVAPLIFTFLLVPHFMRVFHDVSGETLFWTYFFGVLWGLGSLTFGLTLRYLGIGLGMAVALSYTAAFGTMVPPCLDGQILELFTHAWGWVTMVGVFVCLAGIGLSGTAGRAKERELSEQQRQAVVREFDFRRGFLVATFSGVMSSCLNFGYAGLRGFNAAHGQNPITTASAALLRQHGSRIVWDGLPTLMIVLAGGFTTNFIGCMILHLKNHSARQYITTAVAADPCRQRPLARIPGGSEPDRLRDQFVSGGSAVGQPPAAAQVPLFNNYIFCALAGGMWYLQFFFYTAGQTFMPSALAFSGWTLHMASVILFATLWGLVRHEWRGTSKKAHLMIAGGVALLLLSTLIIGGANLMKT